MAPDRHSTAPAAKISATSAERTVDGQQLRLVVPHRGTVLWRRLPFPVRAEHPAPGGGIQRGIEDRVELPGKPPIGDAHLNLDPAVEIAVHQVRAADPVLVRADEMQDARVLEEPAQD